VTVFFPLVTGQALDWVYYFVLHQMNLVNSGNQVIMIRAQ